MVNFDNVSKFVIDDVSLHIPQGEIVGLIGASGAGKTTMIKLACGLLMPESGSVYTLDKDPVINRRAYKGSVGVFITGMPLLSPDDTIAQGFELIRRMYAARSAEFADRYARLSSLLDFVGYDNQPVRSLSLGQRMRAELASVLILEPRLLLLDEPYVGLDESAKASLNELLAEHRKGGGSVLLTSHDMAGVSKICSRIALMDKGRLLFYGSEDNLRGRFAPVETMTLRFGGNIPDFDDLPLIKYSLQGGTVTISYNSNCITSAEILEIALRQTTVREVSICKPNLETIISRMKNGG